MTILPRGTTPDRYTVYALCYGHRAGVRGEHFLGWDATSADRHGTAYYAWLALSSDRTILVDAGTDPAAEPPVTGWSVRTPVVQILDSAGISPDDVDTLILTHLHYDHAGGARTLPRAEIAVQHAELDYWNGPAAQRNMRESWLTDPRDVDHVTARARPLDGDTPIAPGLSAHLVGGHTAGTQIVAVDGAAGRVVLASDAAHFYENLDTDRPGTVLHSTPHVYAAFDRARDLAAGGTVVPGHDPAVMPRFPRVATAIARLA